MSRFRSSFLDLVHLVQLSIKMVSLNASMAMQMEKDVHLLEHLHILTCFLMTILEAAKAVVSFQLDMSMEYNFDSYRME